MEYHANSDSGLRHANRRTTDQLSFEGSWILLLNNNSRELVPITDCSDSKLVAQISRRCPYCPEFVSVICSGPVVRSYQTNLISINGHMPSDNLVEQSQSKVPPAVFKVTPAKIMQHLGDWDTLDFVATFYRVKRTCSLLLRCTAFFYKSLMWNLVL